MSVAPGIIFALLAMLCWGVGDLCIQKTTRALGSVKALFLIGGAGAVALFPFVSSKLPALTIQNMLLLSLLGVVIIFASLFDFEALRLGKIAIVEPIIGLELPITIGLGMTLANEKISIVQLILIATIFTGITFAATRHHTHLHYHRRIFERGVVCAGVGAIGMGLMNFLVGVSSQSISPLITIWFTHSLVAIVCGTYLLVEGDLKSFLAEIRANPKPILGQSILDNAAWVAYAFATTTIPISIAVTISESYIAIAALLGITLNREQLKMHQIFGTVLATVGVITLSAVTS